MPDISMISDYSSLLEIGFGLNITTYYINTFVNPVLKNTRAEMEKFRWWVDWAEVEGSPFKDEVTKEDCEDKLVLWSHSITKLENAIKRHNKKPKGFSIVAALACVILLLMPGLPVNGLGIVGILLLIFGPIALGSLYVSFSCKSERDVVSKAEIRAKSLFV